MIQGLHSKVRWALVAGIVSTVLQAAVGLWGPALPAYVASALTALVGLLAGYAAPSTQVSPGYAEVQDHA